MQMEKLLTVSVAAYQVADYIRQNLDSLLVPEILEELEVFIVDDGGKDETLSIAKEYERKYPDTFHAVHKENGGYGSTVNYSLRNATGKYFKLLDGDDWFDKENLIHHMEILRNTDVDAVAAPYCSGSDVNNMIKKERSWSNLYGKTVAIDEIKNAQIPMWCLTYKTECIKKSGLCLPEHMLYTDYLYAVIPFKCVSNVMFDNVPVYCYRVGRDGQSVSKSSRMKHCQEMIDISIALCRFYESEELQNRRCRQYVLFRCAAACRYALWSLLLFPVSRENREKILQYENLVKRNSMEVYRAVTKVGKFGKVIAFLRLTKYRGLPFVKIIQ